MRDLAQPATLKSSAVAAFASALACYPRLSFWTSRLYPVWYLEAVIFLGSIVLWAFVFAWHTKYSRRPVFAFKPNPELFLGVTLAGVIAAAALRLFLDPGFRLKTPEDYPVNLAQWCALTLFTLGFSQLFLVFAPFAWLLRLFRNQTMAALLTILFGVFILVIKTNASPEPLPLPILGALLLARLVLGFLAVFCYLRGGVFLAWWFGLLVEARHLPGLRAGF